MRYIFILILILFAGKCFAQTSAIEYLNYAGKGDSIFKKGEFQNAVASYSIAFNLTGGLAKVSHRYNIASCWTLLNNKDSAFYQLERIAAKGNYSDYGKIKNDKNFSLLHDDKRWGAILEIIWRNRQHSAIPD